MPNSSILKPKINIIIEGQNKLDNITFGRKMEFQKLNLTLTTTNSTSTFSNHVYLIIYLESNVIH